MGFFPYRQAEIMTFPSISFTTNNKQSLLKTFFYFLGLKVLRSVRLNIKYYLQGVQKVFKQFQKVITKTLEVATKFLLHECYYY